MMLKFCGDYMRFCLALFEVRLQGPKEVGLLPERGFRNPKNRQRSQARPQARQDPPTKKAPSPQLRGGPWESLPRDPNKFFSSHDNVNHFLWKPQGLVSKFSRRGGIPKAPSNNEATPTALKPKVKFP